MVCSKLTSEEITPRDDNMPPTGATSRRPLARAMGPGASERSDFGRLPTFEDTKVMGEATKAEASERKGREHEEAVSAALNLSVGSWDASTVEVMAHKEVDVKGLLEMLSPAPRSNSHRRFSEGEGEGAGAGWGFGAAVPMDAEGEEYSGRSAPMPSDMFACPPTLHDALDSTVMGSSPTADWFAVPSTVTGIGHKRSPRASSLFAGAGGGMECTGGDDGGAGRTEDARASGGKARDTQHGAPASSAGARESAENARSGAIGASGADGAGGAGGAGGGGGSNKSKWWTWSKHPIVAAIGTAILGLGVTYGVVVVRSAFDQWDVAPLDLEYIVPRPQYVDAIRSYVDEAKREYAVVHGERGSGKSTAVWQACQHRRGVIHVKAKGTEEWEVLLKEHMCALTPWYVIPVSPSLILRHAQAVRKVFGCTTPLVVVTEVVSSVDRKQVGLIAKAMKHYAGDKGLGSFVLVLSDAASAQEIPQDASRQTFFWVSDFAKGEAMEYLGLRTNWSEGFRERVCSEVGLRPVSLRKVVDVLSGKEGHELDRALNVFVEKLKGNARKNIMAVVRNEPMFEGLLKAIVDGRCSMQQFKKKEFGCDPGEVMRAMPSNSRVLVYEPTTDSYRFFSPAHEAEARRLIKEDK